MVEKIRPFDPLNPDWKREYTLLYVSAVGYGAAVSNYLEHKEVCIEKECVVDLLLLLLLRTADRTMYEVVSRVPRENMESALGEVTAIVKAEREADASMNES